MINMLLVSMMDALLFDKLVWTALISGHPKDDICIMLRNTSPATYGTVSDHSVAFKSVFQILFLIFGIDIA